MFTGDRRQQPPGADQHARKMEKGLSKADRQLEELGAMIDQAIGALAHAEPRLQLVGRGALRPRAAARRRARGCPAHDRLPTTDRPRRCLNSKPSAYGTAGCQPSRWLTSRAAASSAVAAEGSYDRRHQPFSYRDPDRRPADVHPLNDRQAALCRGRGGRGGTGSRRAVGGDPSGRREPGDRDRRPRHLPPAARREAAHGRAVRRRRQARAQPGHRGGGGGGGGGHRPPGAAPSHRRTDRVRGGSACWLWRPD